MLCGTLLEVGRVTLLAGRLGLRELVYRWKDVQGRVTSFSPFILLLNEHLVEKVKTIELILVDWEWRSNGG